MKKIFQSAVAASAAVVASSALARIEMGTPFSDHAVLQRGMEVPVWGRAEPGAGVCVRFAGEKLAATADGDGRWMVTLPAMEASSEGRVMTVSESKSRLFWFDKTTDTVEISDILVGEVWFASGQSNMECPIWGPNPRYRDANGALVASMDRLPNVRFAKNARAWSVAPAEAECEGWKPFDPSSHGGLEPSAVAYYFARELYLALGGVPVGIVDSSWSGTNIDAWTPRAGYEDCDPSLAGVAAWPVTGDWRKSMAKDPVTDGHQQPTVLFNGMVDSWAPMAMRGFIWYQGCNNAREPRLYRAKMRALLDGWSRRFGNPGLRLYFVQLAPFNQNWPGIVAAQTAFAEEEPNAALAVTADVGNFDDIHPNGKEIVAKRLAVHALRRDYGFDIPEDDSPVLDSVTFADGAATMRFRHAAGFYVYAPNRSVEPAFEVAGADGVWKGAKLQNVEWNGVVKGAELVVKSPQVPEPKKVRYLLKPRTMGTVYNEASLPLGPFEASE